MMILFSSLSKIQALLAIFRQFHQPGPNPSMLPDSMHQYFYNVSLISWLQSLLHILFPGHKEHVRMGCF
jgi:hypothetical protein